MKFSIVLPAYNVGRYIERCLLSCIYQTYDEIEIIVVDDCGQDDSIDQVNRIAQIDARVKVVRNAKNMGTYHARRMGAEFAAGEYILFLDPDDELKRNALELISNKLGNKKDIVVYGVEVLPEKRFYQNRTGLPKLTSEHLDTENIEKIFSAKGFNLGTPGKVFNRKVLLTAYRNLNVPESLRLVFAEDQLLFAEILNVSSNISLVNERLYIYHTNIDSITQVGTDEALKYMKEQVEICVSLILDRANSCRGFAHIFMPVANRLMVDARKIDIRLSDSFLYNLRSYLFIIRKSKNIKYLLRIMVYIISAKKIKLV